MANLRRLIDLDKIDPIYFPSTEMDGLDVVRYLNTLPTVDAVEVVHGRWGTFEMFPETPFLNGFPCSVCGKRVPFILGYNFKYCPNCGAKMDGVSDG